MPGDGDLLVGAWLFEKITGLAREAFPERHGGETNDKPKLEKLEDHATVGMVPGSGNEEARRRLFGKQQQGGFWGPPGLRDGKSTNMHECLCCGEGGAVFVLDGRGEPRMVRSGMSSFYLIALLAAFCIGLSKAGFSGISMVSVFLLADLYGAKASVGLALPLLIAADLMAYPAFIKHGSWKPVWRLLGPSLVGLGLGWWMLGWIDDAAARRVIGACVLLMVALQGSRRWHPEWFDRCVESRGFGLGAGVLGGFSTMLANAAGPVIQLYLTARKVPKMELIGIGARFFLLINLLKVPLNARLALITSDSLWENARLLPGVVLGIFGGRWLIHHVPQAAFEWMIVVFSLLAGLRLLFW